jgi:hypothetical protein
LRERALRRGLGSYRPTAIEGLTKVHNEEFNDFLLLVLLNQE